MNRTSCIALIAFIAIILTYTTATMINGDNMMEFLQSNGHLPTPKKMTQNDLLAIEKQLYEDLTSSASDVSPEELEAYNDEVEGMGYFEREERAIQGLHDDLKGAFDMTILKQRAAYSSIARCITTNPASVSKWTCAWCKDGKVPLLTETVAGIEGKSKLGWFAGYDAKFNRIVLVFKSTGGAENWLLDLDFAMIPYSPCTDCKAHKGFINGYKDQLRPVFIPALQKLQKAHPSATVVITGHSLGAALTTHAAIDLKFGLFVSLNFNGVDIIHNTNFGAYNDLSDDHFAQLYALQHKQELSEVKTMLFGHKVGLQQGEILPVSDIKLQQNNLKGSLKATLEFPIYNFGSPRTFNQAGADWFNTQIGGRTNFRRVSHVGDTCTHVPTIALGGRHIGNEVYFYEKNLSMNYRVCSTSDSEDKTCGYKDIAIDFMQHKWYGGYSMLQEVSDCQ